MHPSIQPSKPEGRYDSVKCLADPRTSSNPYVGSLFSIPVSTMLFLVGLEVEARRPCGILTSDTVKVCDSVIGFR